MIRLNDLGVITLAKLKAHRLRTIVIVFTTALLFSATILLSLVSAGLSQSIRSFRHDRLTDRYIVTVSSATTSSNSNLNYLQSSIVQERLTVEYKRITKNKQQLADKLGVTYDQTNDQPPYLDPGDNLEIIPNISSPIAQTELANRWKGIPSVNETKLRSISQDYHAKSSFFGTTFTVNGELQLMKGGQETFYDDTNETDVNAKVGTIHMVELGAFKEMPLQLIKEYMLPDNANWQPTDGTIPILLPADSIEKLLGLSKLSGNSSTQKQLNRLQEIRNRAAKLTFSTCYRNKSSAKLIQEVISQNKMARHKQDSNYTPPLVTYQLPDPSTCSSPIITKDLRTNTQKEQTAKQQLFDEQYNDYEQPDSQIITFKVVGVTPAKNGQSSTTMSSIQDIFTNLLSIRGLDSSIVPTELYNLSDKKSTQAGTDIFDSDTLYSFGNDDRKTWYVEFSNPQDMRQFVNEQGCTLDENNICQPANRQYQLETAFTSSAAVTDVERTVQGYITLSILVVSSLGIIIMALTISRTISDDRHESAVFQAIGFNRLDIAMIYIMYGTNLSIFVAILALVIGYSGAYIANLNLAPGLTAMANYSFMSLDNNRTLTTLGVNYTQIAVIIMAIIGVGLISALLASLTIRRHSVIEDLKKD